MKKKPTPKKGTKRSKDDTVLQAHPPNATADHSPGDALPDRDQPRDNQITRTPEAPQPTIVSPVNAPTTEVPPTALPPIPDTTTATRTLEPPLIPISPVTAPPIPNDLPPTSIVVDDTVHQHTLAHPSHDIDLTKEQPTAPLPGADMECDEPRRTVYNATTENEPECRIPLYACNIYSSGNIEETKVRVTSFLEHERKTRNIPPGEDYMFIPDRLSILPCFRKSLVLEDVEQAGGAAAFEIPYNTMDPPPMRRPGEKHPREFILMMRQRDGFCCAGAAILTCTAGHTFVPPEMVEAVMSHVGRTSKWNTPNDNMRGGLLPTEGTIHLVTNRVGILPCMTSGLVARTHSFLQMGKAELRFKYSHFSMVPAELLHPDDDMFQDIRFQKLMHAVRYASVLANDTKHWYSVVCIPRGTDYTQNAYLVCDPLRHNEVTLYQSYVDFWTDFLHCHIIPRIGNISSYKNYAIPVSVVFYPVVQTQQDADPETARIMEQLLCTTMETMKEGETPFVGWKSIANWLN